MAEPGVAVAPRGAPTRQKAGPRMKREKVKPRSRQLPLHTEASSERAQVQKAARRMQKTSYLVFSLASSTLMTGLVILATYYRFYLQQETAGEELPWEEMLSTALLTAGSAIGMEFWARWAHRALWHGSMWELDEKLRVGMLKPIEELHKSHHKPRKGAFEANDIFAVINGVPATSLCAYGFFHSGIVGGLAFGAGLGITLYGIAYMFVHDGAISMPILSTKDCAINEWNSWNEVPIFVRKLAFERCLFLPMFCRPCAPPFPGRTN